jgi:hypothetical protein
MKSSIFRNLTAIAGLIAFAAASAPTASAAAQPLPEVRCELFVYQKNDQGVAITFNRSAPMTISAAESRLKMNDFEIKADIDPSCEEDQAFCYRHQLIARISKGGSASQSVYPIGDDSSGILSATLLVGNEEAALNCTVEN